MASWIANDACHDTRRALVIVEVDPPVPDVTGSLCYMHKRLEDCAGVVWSQFALLETALRPVSHRDVVKTQAL